MAAIAVMLKSEIVTIISCAHKTLILPSDGPRDANHWRTAAIRAAVPPRAVRAIATDSWSDEFAKPLAHGAAAPSTRGTPTDLDSRTSSLGLDPMDLIRGQWHQHRRRRPYASARKRPCE